MSLPDSASPASARQKQSLNVYTMMLVISFFAIVIACILLFVEINRFGSPFGNPPPWNTQEAQPRRQTSSVDLSTDVQSLGWPGWANHAKA